MRRIVWLLGMLALAAAGCGAEKSALAEAQDELGQASFGTLALTFTAGADDGDGVGFSLHGPFDLRGKEGDLPRAELTFERIGVKAKPVTFVSDGRTARVGSTPLTGAELDGLRLSGKTEGVAGLDLGDWAEGKATKTGERIEADVDPVKALNDVFTLAGQFGDGGVKPLEGEAAEKLRKAVESARVVVDQGDPYTLRLDIRFLANQLPEALGQYVRPWLRLDLRVDR